MVIELDGGNADFPYLVSDYHIAILPAEGDGINWRSGVGCGGYKLVHFEPGVRSEFVRSENYWKQPHRAHFDEVELLSIVDVAARTNALKTGEIDTMDRCDLKTVHLLAKTPGLVVEETTGTGHYSIPMRTDTAPTRSHMVPDPPPPDHLLGSSKGTPCGRQRAVPYLYHHWFLNNVAFSLRSQEN